MTKHLPVLNGVERSDTEGQIFDWIEKQYHQRPIAHPKRLPTSDDLSSCQSNLDVALCYASAGWSVFPITSTLINQNKNRLNKATTEYKTIKNLWSDQANAPVGIRTGSASGLLVLEHNINSDGNGAGELRQLLKNADVEMRDVPTVKTPNGYYYIYKWPKRAKSLTESLNKYVRIRGEGDYIIAPGSRNTNDITHNWYAGDDPSKCSLQIPPHGLLALIQKSESETVSPPSKIKTQINKGRKSSLTPVDLKLSVKLRDDCLVEDMLFKGDLALMVGKEAVGKSFIAIDLATCLATGQSWAGQTVIQCPVLYLALEGERGITQRFIAQVEKNRHAFENQTIPLAFQSPALDLCNPNAEEVLMNAIEVFKANFNCTPSLIIIDTLAQAFGGDENSSEHMRECLKSLKTMIRKTGVTFLLIHHFGKDLKNGPRGHSSLAAACDTIFSLVKKEDGINLSEQKQKDADCTFKTRVELNPTTLESQDHGSEKPITTCLPSYSNTTKKGG